MYFGKNILKYKEDILKDLKTLISFQSISGENQGDCEAGSAFCPRPQQCLRTDNRSRIYWWFQYFFRDIAYSTQAASLSLPDVWQKPGRTDWEALLYSISWCIKQKDSWVHGNDKWWSLCFPGKAKRTISGTLINVRNG